MSTKETLSRSIKLHSAIMTIEAENEIQQIERKRARKSRAIQRKRLRAMWWRDNRNEFFVYCLCGLILAAGVSLTMHFQG